MRIPAASIQRFPYQNTRRIVRCIIISYCTLESVINISSSNSCRFKAKVTETSPTGSTPHKYLNIRCLLRLSVNRHPLVEGKYLNIRCLLRLSVDRHPLVEVQCTGLTTDEQLTRTSVGVVNRCMTPLYFSRNKTICRCIYHCSF